MTFLFVAILLLMSSSFYSEGFAHLTPKYVHHGIIIRGESQDHVEERPFLRSRVSLSNTRVAASTNGGSTSSDMASQDNFTSGINVDSTRQATLNNLEKVLPNL